MTEINSELPEVERTAAPIPASFMRAVIMGSLAVAVLALLLFSWIAHEVFEGDASRFDGFVRGGVHQYASPPLTRAMMAISHLGSAGLAAVVVIGFAVFLYLRWRWAALWLLLAAAGGLVLELTLKNAYQRARPAPFFGAVPHTYSFPSGHALMSFCVYGVLAGLLSHRIRSRALRVTVWVLAAVLVVAIGLSRIYLGVHYPSDVLSGYLAGAVWSSALIAADRVRKRRRLRAQPNAP